MLLYLVKFSHSFQISGTTKFWENAKKPKSNVLFLLVKNRLSFGSYTKSFEVIQKVMKFQVIQKVLLK
jgi:hypothetical protein